MMENPRLPFLADKAHRLPLLPGVYIMKNKAGEIIYVGKAKALKNRVSSYFRSVEKHLPKVYKMVSQVHDFDYIVTDSEFEALVLECSLIKQHAPKYNILLKDDKGYSYIKVYPKEFSRIRMALQKDDEPGATYIGPYMSSYVVRETVDEANKAFKLPTCTRKFPQEFGKGRPCLNYHIKQCMGVCLGKVSLEEYNEVLEQALDYIKGGSAQSVQKLTQRMEECAENMEFEKAAQLRDRIRAISRLAQADQKVIWAKGLPDQDVVALQRVQEETCAVVLKFRGERLVDKQDFLLGEVEELTSARLEFLLRYYNTRQEIPKRIQLDGEIEDMELTARWLTQQGGHKVELRVPQRGEQLKLVELARKNAAEKLALRNHRSGREVAALDELARLLGLDKPPAYIEAYDISNIGSATVVAGMVVFENGRPQKRLYRKFNIQTVSGTDDYAENGKRTSCLSSEKVSAGKTYNVSFSHSTTRPFLAGVFLLVIIVLQDLGGLALFNNNYYDYDNSYRNHWNPDIEKIFSPVRHTALCWNLFSHSGHSGVNSDIASHAVAAYHVSAHSGISSHRLADKHVKRILNALLIARSILECKHEYRSLGFAHSRGIVRYDGSAEEIVAGRGERSDILGGHTEIALNANSEVGHRVL